MKNYKYYLEGLDCANCAKKIEDKISEIEGFENVVVNFSTLKLSFQTEKEGNIKGEIEELIHSLEPDVVVTQIEPKENNFTQNASDSASITEKDKATKSVKVKANNREKAERNSNDIIRLIIGVAIYFIGTNLQQIIPFSNYFENEVAGKLHTSLQIIVTVISLIILLAKIVPKAWKQIFKNHVLDENTLISISAIGACLVGEAMEGIMVITLYEIGKILEAKAVSKTRKSISDLMDIKPEYANLKVGDETKKVSPDDVKIGDIIVIKNGEKIPLDGIVIKGEAEIDNSALTGESILVKVQEKSKVLSGGINVQGLLEVKVQKTYENSTVSQILNLVENATDKKAKTETVVAKAAKIYTPVVLGLALLVAIFMPLVVKQVTYKESIYKALIFLVISCPCSIAISVPLSYFSGIGRASKKGILIKGSDYLDGLKDVGQIVFDKTGTITTGSFKVANIQVFSDNYIKEQVLNYFAMGERFSNHPIAKSILKEVSEENLETSKVEELEEISGKGIKYKYDGKTIKIGNAIFVGFDIEQQSNYQNQNTQNNLNKNKTAQEKTTEYEEKTIGTILYLKVNEDVIGSILLSDEIKPDAKRTIQQLKKLGIKTKMFTGDKREIAESIAKQVGIDEVKSQMLPQNKYAELEKVLEENRIKTPNKKVAYVGDGINDSPVLARADIGISMGGIGSSSAIEASDVVIMTDELSKITEGIEISKKTNRVIKQNLIFAIGVKLLIFVLSLFGFANMWEAVFADVGTTLITILNTMFIWGRV